MSSRFGGATTGGRPRPPVAAASRDFSPRYEGGFAAGRTRASAPPIGGHRRRRGETLRVQVIPPARTVIRPGCARARRGCNAADTMGWPVCIEGATLPPAVGPHLRISVAPDQQHALSLSERVREPRRLDLPHGDALRGALDR